MAELSLKDTLDSIRDGIQSRSKMWENVIFNFSEGYDIAIKNHEDNLPTKMVEELLLIVFSMISAGSTAWLTGGYVVAMTPIASAITKIGEKLAEPPDNSVLRISGAPASSSTYLKYLKSALNTFEGNALEFIRTCRYKLDEKGDISISADDKNEISKLVELSPYWHPPSNLKVWNEELQKEIAVEFEIGFWAEWGKQLGKAGFDNLGRYDFDKASIRLEKLNVTIPSYPAGRKSLQEIKVSGAKGGMSRSIGGGINNRWWAQELANWGENYIPKKTFGDPLPNAVSLYMFSKQSPELLELLKKGVEYLDKMNLRSK